MSTPYKANVKVVPNSKPNADGQWFTVEYGEDTMNRIKDAIDWHGIWSVFEGVIPDNHHIVQLELNAKVIFSVKGRELRMT